MSELIEPRLLKGFRDFLPADQRERLRTVRILEEVFSSFGFEPIDTPVLEYTEILLGKGGGETDKQVYRFNDQGGRDVAMRYDLTVPFARFMALHLHELSLPFKRYHIAKVFRGENTQRGRYREFMQCDFDIVGSDTVSSDFETVMLMDRSFRALGIENVRIHIAHRSVFNTLLGRLGTESNSVEILRAVDKLRKIGKDKVHGLLTDLASADAADAILAFVAGAGDNASTLAAMRQLVPGDVRGLDRLEAVLEAARVAGMSDRIVLDPSITRGLDYYTGIVFETFLTELPAIGSVCSGGRYDNLASLYSKQELPGVGASIGLDRLMAGLQELGASGRSEGTADALVICAEESAAGLYHTVADALRKENLRIDVMPNPRKPVQQFKLAENRAIPAAVFVPEGWTPGSKSLSVRNLATRESSENLSVAEAASAIRAAGSRQKGDASA